MQMEIIFAICGFIYFIIKHSYNMIINNLYKVPFSVGFEIYSDVVYISLRVLEIWD